MRTVSWDSERKSIVLIDQRLLPAEYRLVAISDYRQVAQAIGEMIVRGAPAIGVTAAFGVALAALQSPAHDLDGLRADLQAASQVVQAARPTAVNLSWALQRMGMLAETFAGSADDLRAALLALAQAMADEDVEINRRMATHGAQLIDDGDTVLHHCNTGALAAVDWGTALGVIRMAHEQGKRVHVLVDETRPRLQGARLTAWELEQYRISYDVIVDGAAGYFLRSGRVQKVFYGADRVAANGDIANKIGTYMLSLAAHANGVPVYPVVPSSTIDFSLPEGGQIPIEMRPADEVRNIQVDGQAAFPAGASALNPAFDITPHHLLTAIVTEHGVIAPPFEKNLAGLRTQFLP